MRAAKLEKGIKYFQLYAAVVIKTAAMSFCRGRREIVVCCTCSARTCIHSTNKILNLWHFRFRSVVDSKVRYSF